MRKDRDVNGSGLSMGEVDLMTMSTTTSSTSNDLDAGAFLDLLHGADAPIYFNVAGRTWKNRPQTFRQAEATLRWRNAEGEDICFLVNGGGTKDREISRFNACFIDWDCGRDQDGRYWPQEHVTKAKLLFSERLASFANAPSILVETRNGYHAYWLLDGDVTAGQFRDCQQRLAKFFGGDPTVCNPARAMRLPGFDWVKRDSGYAPFSVRVVAAGGARFRIEYLLEVLPAVRDEALHSRGDQSVGTKGCVGKCAPNKCESSSTLALIGGANPVQQADSMPSVADAMEYLKRQDLRHYLGLGTSSSGADAAFTCPFHADTTPSASVFRNDETGHWLFKCHSTRCGVSGTILDVAMRTNGLPDEGAALRHLLGHYGVAIESGWKDAQKARIEVNITLLRDAPGLKSRYPHLNRLIGRVRHDLICKLRWAKDHVVSERYRLRDDAVFFCSLRQFHKLATRMDEAPTHYSRQNEKVDRYCLLGLLRKLPDGDLPAGALAEARAWQREKRFAYRIQWYAVPTYTEDVLRGADERARLLIAAGVSMRGISRELVLSVFGEELTKEIYPQWRPPAGSADGFVVRLTQILVAQVAAAGYTTVAAVRHAMRSDNEWKSVTERRIEKVLPGILAQCGLRKVTCDGPRKTALGIRRLGYPKVIVRDDRPGSIGSVCGRRQAG